MTDTTNFHRTLIAQVTQFVAALEQLKLMADRISADSSLSAKAAAAAQAAGRSDLTAANFDNFNVATQLLVSLLESNANTTVTNNVNFGGKAVLAFYQLM